MKNKKQSTISHAYTWVHYNEGKITPIADKWMMGTFQSKQKAIAATMFQVACIPTFKSTNSE